MNPIYPERMAAVAARPVLAPFAGEVAGGGDTALVLIHGFPLTSAMWARQADALASATIRVVTPDLPGFGRTPGAITSVAEAADGIAALIDEVGARRVVLGGFSMGGYIAFAFVRRYAARLDGLILVDTKAEADTPEGRDGRYALAERVQDDGVEIVIDAMLPRLVSDGTLRSRPDVVQQVRDIAGGSTLEGVVGALRAMAERPSSVPDLPRIAVPTLIIVGREDVITPPSDAETMRAGINGSEMAIIPDAGHLTPMEQPDVVNGVIRGWLAANISP
jgi:pimeloyl-ACP methyl ester carboxylesterase